MRIKTPATRARTAVTTGGMAVPTAGTSIDNPTTIKYTARTIKPQLEVKAKAIYTFL